MLSCTYECIWHHSTKTRSLYFAILDSIFFKLRTMIADVASPHAAVFHMHMNIDPDEEHLEEADEEDCFDPKRLQVMEEIVRRNSVSPSTARKQIIKISISGSIYEVSMAILSIFPDTLLGNSTKRSRFYDPAKGIYQFERHRPCFDAILYYYQSGGYLKRPSDIPLGVFQREIEFFGINDNVGTELENDQGGSEIIDPKGNWVSKLHMLLEYPNSSMAAKCFGITSFCAIILATLSFCLETVPWLNEYFKCAVNETLSNEVTNVTSPTATLWELANNSTTSMNFMQNNSSQQQQHQETIGVLAIPSTCQSTFWNPFAAVETACIAWFTVEFILRFGCCPSRAKFLKSFLNWVDVVAIIPFYINPLISVNAFGSAASLSILRVLRLVRVFRIFKLSRHSRGLQILGRTIAASIRELLFLMIFMLIALVVTGSAAYFAEYEKNPEFSSIPQAFWFSVTTLTTVGYGDITPATVCGKIVGAACSIIGVLCLALPVTVIVSNFKRFYEQEQNAQVLSKRRSTTVAMLRKSIV